MIANSHVSLVGAGPGDPELITLKAIHALAKADCVLVDHLVHDSILTHCKPTADIIYVGKQKGKHSATQAEIHEHLLTQAQQGKIIVRLKGGDPFIFGRIGEEMQFLSTHNIPFSIIPGISTASAGPGYMGIPLTHRDQSRSVAFVTGTLKKDKAPLDIPNADTLVFFMGYSNLKHLVTTLKTIKQPDTPITLISQATLATQRSLTGTLENIVELADTQPLPTPILIVVGSVVDLQNHCTWQHNKPLSKKRIVLFRETSQAKDWIKALAQEGADVLHLPLQTYAANPNAYKKLSPELIKKTTHLIFSSHNAVTHFFKALEHARLDARNLNHIYILSIGQNTSKTLNKNNIIPDQEAPSPTLDSLLTQLPQTLNAHVLYPTSAKSPATFETYCQQSGLSHTRLNLYTPTLTAPKTPPSLTNTDTLVFTSPSTLDHLKTLNIPIPATCTKIAIGPTTAAYLKQHQLGPIKELEEPTIDALIHLLRP